MSRYPHQDAIDALLRKMEEGNGHGHQGHDNGDGGRNGPTAAFRTDAEILAKCRAANNAPKFSALYDEGDVHAYHGGDDSAADLALISMMAPYTQDQNQLDRLHRGSALMREKWNRDDYRRRTIEKALSGLGWTYSWPETSDHDSTGTGTGTPNMSGTGTGRERRRSQAFSEMPAPAARVYLVEGLVPEAYPTMIYGDGGVAKSLLALSLGLAVSSGASSWLGRKIEAGGVLYLDFELDAPEQMRRVSQLARAEGLDTLPSNLRYMSAIGVKAREAFADALAECQEHGIRLLVVDSLGPALDGDAEASRDVITFYNEVIGPFRAAGVAPLVIDHQSKQQAGERYQSKRAFGSVFKSNLARSVVQVEATDRQDGELTVRLRQNKHNFGPQLKPFGARLDFSEERITVEPVELDDADLAEEGTISARERVRLALGMLGEATRAEIHEQLSDLSSGTVKKELGKLCGSGVAEWTGEVRERQQVARLTGTGTGHYKGTGTGTGSSDADLEREIAEMVKDGWGERAARDELSRRGRRA